MLYHNFTNIICKCFNYSLFLSSVDFSFKVNIFVKFYHEYHHVASVVCILIKPDVLRGLIWIQTICKDDQQITKYATDMLKAYKDQFL